jgi:hypothetical protein
MSYSGTVCCRYCGQEGHNRRTCPDYKALLARQAGDGNKWAQAQLAAKNRKSVRKCGWCNETGHNKRTCPGKAAAYKLLGPLKIAVTRVVEKATEGVGRGSIFNTGFETNNIALRVRKRACFGGARISEDTVEENRDNTNWLLRILRSLTDRIDYKCVAPDGTTHYHRTPLRKLSFRDDSISIGTTSTTVAISSPSPIEYDVTVELSTGITDVNVKGWIKVIDLLVNEVVWGN